MNLIAILSVHNNKDLVLDTLDSIRRYMTKDILLLVDGAYWHEWEDLDIPVYKLKGFNHAWPEFLLWNIFLGLMMAGLQWNADWFCYIEYDCLVGSREV